VGQKCKNKYNPAELYFSSGICRKTSAKSDLILEEDSLII
jgi:hypothetical protein